MAGLVDDLAGALVKEGWHLVATRDEGGEASVMLSRPCEDREHHEDVALCLALVCYADLPSRVAGSSPVSRSKVRISGDHDAPIAKRRTAPPVGVAVSPE